MCAVASRFYEEKPEVYPMAVHMAKAAAANAFLDGCKTVEMCQAFAIMSAYMPPARRWDEDRQFFYSGIAFRCVSQSRPDVRCVLLMMSLFGGA